MKSKLILIFLFYFRLTCLSQVPNIEWQHCYGGGASDVGTSIIQTPDSGFLLFGLTSSSDGDVNGYHPGACGNFACFDFWAVKTDNSGNLLWQKCLGGTNDEYTRHAVNNQPSGFLFMGLTKSNDGDINFTHGDSEAWLTSLSDSGTLMFEKCFGGSGFDGGIQSLVLLNNNEAIFCGNTYSNDGDVSGNHGSSDIWLVKINIGAGIIWQKCIGGSLNEYAGDMILSVEGKILLGGQALSNDGDITVPSLGGIDYWICCLDTAGNLLWQKSYGGSYNDIMRGMKLTRDGGLILVGSTDSNDGSVSGNHGSTDYWVVKLDSVGNLQWEKCLGGTAIDDGFGIDTTDDGGYVVGGIVSSDDGDINNSVDINSDNAWVVKLDSLGNIVWDRSIGGTSTDEVQDVKTMLGGAIMLLGGTRSNDIDVSGNHGSSDFWVVKLAPLPNNIPSNISSPVHLSAYFNSNLFLDFYLSKTEALTFQLFDITGRLLLSKSLAGEIGLNKKKLELPEISKGLYFINLITLNRCLTKKVVIE